MSSLQILLIEEDVISREVLNLMLSKKFNLTVLDKMNDAEKQIMSMDYDIVIMDIHCTEFDGLALCRRIASVSMAAPPLVIALGEDASEEKIRQSFEAGAYDYFVKPYNVVLFYESLQRLVKTLSDYQHLEKSDKSSRDTVGIALAQASYYGFASDLLSEITHTKTIESLSDTVLKGFSSKGIHCAIQITDAHGKIFTSEENTDVVGERTLQVFSVVKDQGRIFRFGKRLVFNDEHVSLFVKSIEDSGATAYDCILDIGAKVITCIEKQIFAVSEHLLLIELQLNTKKIVTDLHSALTKQSEQTDKVIQKIATSINASFHELGLTEDQERFFMNLIETELQVESAGIDFESLEGAAQEIYNKISELQDQTEKQDSVSSQFSDIDFF